MHVAQLGPGYLRMDSGALGRSRCGDDAFLAHDFSEGDDGIGDEFPMLDELHGVAGNSRNQDLPRGEFHVRQTLVTRCS